MRILIVDDHAETRELLLRHLGEHGHQAHAAGSCADARQLLASERFALVILDVLLPDGSGVDLCREWREQKVATPILLLSARGQVGDRVRGLDAGADDYLPKPFALSELMARVRALSRRDEPRRGTRLTLGPLVIDLRARRVFVADAPVPITAKELAILEVLATRVGRVVGKDDLLESVWGEVTEAHAASLEVAVHRLRRKLGAAADLLKTMRGVGYLLEPPAP